MSDPTHPQPPIQDTDWRLVDARSGQIYPIPQGGLVIGRDDECDVVLSGKGVSRRHAIIRRAGSGWTVTDESSNGTFVNDVRVQRLQTLARGDTLRIGDDLFRLESNAGAANAGDATEAIAAVSDAPNDERTVRARGATQNALASLEVLKGPLAGTRFVVVRPVSAIGKSERNDVVVVHETVSATHATLMFKAGAWYITDERSLNGTFVDGYRIAGERELPAGSVLSLGEVKMVFRPVSRVPDGARGTAPVAGLIDRLARMLRNK